MQVFAQVWLAFLVLCAPLTVFGDEASDVRTLNETLELLDEAPLLQATLSDVEAAKALVRQAWGAWLPSFEISGFATAMPAHRGGPLQGAVDSSDWGPWLGAGVRGGIPVFTFGQLGALESLARDGVDVAWAERRVVRNGERLRHIHAYHDAQLARWKKQILADYQDVVNGLMTELDTRALSSEQREAASGRFLLMQTKVQEAHLKADEAMGRSARRLAQTLGLSSLDFAVTPLPLETDYASQIPLVECLQEALTARPDIRLGREMLVAGEANVLFQKLRWLPGFAIVASIERKYAPKNDNQVGSYRRDPYNGGGTGGTLAAEWDIRPSTRLDELAEGERMLDGGRPYLEYAILNGLYEVKKAHVRLEGSARYRDAARAASVSAIAWFKQSVVGYRAQTISLDRLADAFSESLRREPAYAESVHGYLKAKAELEAQAGTPCLVSGSQ